VAELRSGACLARHADRRVCMPRPPGGDPTRHLRSGINRKKRSRAGCALAAYTPVHRLLFFLCALFSLSLGPAIGFFPTGHQAVQEGRREAGRFHQAARFTATEGRQAHRSRQAGAAGGG
jgi:hypothetical protein